MATGAATAAVAMASTSFLHTVNVRPGVDRRLPQMVGYQPIVDVGNHGPFIRVSPL